MDGIRKRNWARSTRIVCAVAWIVLAGCVEYQVDPRSLYPHVATDVELHQAIAADRALVNQWATTHIHEIRMYVFDLEEILGLHFPEMDEQVASATARMFDLRDPVAMGDIAAVLMRAQVVWWSQRTKDTHGTLLPQNLWIVLMDRYTTERPYYAESLFFGSIVRLVIRDVSQPPFVQPNGTYASELLQGEMSLFRENLGFLLNQP